MKNKTPFLLCLILLIQVFPLSAEGFLNVKGKIIVDSTGNEFILRGIGLGGWMIQEGYMFETSAFANAQHEIRSKIEALIGKDKTDTYYKAHLTNFVTKADIDSLAKWGFNSVRLPMHYNLYTPLNQANAWLEEGFRLTDSLLTWCKQNRLYLILDLHAAPGGQSNDNISDYDAAYPSLWESADNRLKTVQLWQKLADRYKNESWIGGYDLINEPKWSLPQNKMLRDLYKQITDSIRLIDKNHIVFIEGNWYATDFSGLSPAWDDNMVYSFHKYWNDNTKGSIQGYLDLSNSTNRPLWLGESGENSNVWITNCIKLVEQNHIGWAMWPLKKVSSVTGPLTIIKTDNYQKLLNYWNGTGAKPSADEAFNTLMELTDKSKVQQCIFHPDFIDAMFRLVSDITTKPFADNLVPGTIYATDYDFGPIAHSYYDQDYQNTQGAGAASWNSGGAYRNDGVDIEKCSDGKTNGYNVGWIVTGEWLSFTINITVFGIYPVDFRVASKDGGGKLHLELDDNIITGYISVNATGGYQSWVTVSSDPVNLNSGLHKLKVKFDIGGFNLNYIEFKNPNSIDVKSFDNNELKIFPNPSTDKTLNIALNENITVEPFNVQIYNVNGQLKYYKLYYKPENPIKIDLSGFIEGFYFVKTGNERIQYSAKLVIR